jgi:hypothetical protein
MFNLPAGNYTTRWHRLYQRPPYDFWFIHGKKVEDSIHIMPIHYD